MFIILVFLEYSVLYRRNSMFIDGLTEEIYQKAGTTRSAIAIGGPLGTGKTTLALLTALEYYRTNKIRSISIIGIDLNHKEICDFLKQHYPEFDSRDLKIFQNFKTESNGEVVKSNIPELERSILTSRMSSVRGVLIIDGFSKMFLEPPTFDANGAVIEEANHYTHGNMLSLIDAIHTSFSKVILVDGLRKNPETYVNSYTGRSVDVVLVTKVKTTIVGRVFSALVKTSNETLYQEDLKIIGGKVFNARHKRLFEGMIPALYKGDMRNLTSIYEPTFDK